MRLSTAFLIALLSFFTSSSNNLVDSILSIYAHSFLGVPLAGVGIIVSALFITSFLVKIPIGILVKSSQILVLIPISYLFLTLSMLGYYFVSEPNLMIALRLFHGVWYSTSYIPLMSLASLTVAREKVSASVNAFMTAGGLGLMAGPMIGTISTAFLGVRESFLIASVMAGIGTAVALAIAKRKPMGHADVLPVNLFAPKRFALLAVSRRVFLPSVYFLVFMTVYAIMVAYAPILAASKYVLKPSDITSIFFAYFAVSTFFRLPLTKLLKRFTARTLMTISLLNCAVGVLIIGLGEGIWFFVVGFLVVGLGGSWISPVTAIIIAQFTSSEERNPANSIYEISFDLAFLAGPLVAASIVVNVGIPLTLAVSALIPVAGLVANSLIRLQRQTPSVREIEIR